MSGVDVTEVINGSIGRYEGTRVTITTKEE
jgi:hypothetical protein